MNVLIQLTESDKRVIFAICFLLFLVFFIVGYIGVLIVRIIKRQGEKFDNLIADPVFKRVITERKHFVTYARKKNDRLFYKRSRIPLLILISAVLTLVIANAFIGWDFNPFADEARGFGSLLFKWDFAAEGVWVKLFDWFPVMAKWPPLVHAPEFKVEAIGSYIFVIGLFVGGIWYLCNVTVYIARFYRIEYLARKIFSKKLENYNSPLNKFIFDDKKEEAEKKEE